METYPTNGTHPDTGLYHVDHMPVGPEPERRVVREKQLAGQSLTIAEGMLAGRDTVVTELEGVTLKPDHVYRAIGSELLKVYQEADAVVGMGEGSEYAEGNNGGVDWYLGGVALRYGEVVLEAPASPDLFKPANNWGHNLAKNPKVRHMKSSGATKPVPMERVNILLTPDK